MTYKSKMKPIPVLPKEISLSDINRGNINLTSLPIGMVKKDLSIATIKLVVIISFIIINTF